MALPNRLVVDGVRIPAGVLRCLRETLTERGIKQWLRAKTRLLHGKTPLEYLKKGGRQAVLRAAQAYAEGTYI